MQPGNLAPTRDGAPEGAPAVALIARLGPRRALALPRGGLGRWAAVVAPALPRTLRVSRLRAPAVALDALDIAREEAQVLAQLADDKNFQQDIRVGDVSKALRHWTGRERLSASEAGELFDRKVPAPFKPEVASELDVKYVPKTYLQARAEDSIDPAAAKPARGAKPASEFSGFTYVQPSKM